MSSGRRRKRFQRRFRWTLRRESISRVCSVSRRNALRSGSLIPVVAVVSPGSKALAAAWESGSAGPLVQAARPAIRMRQGNNLFMGSHLAGDPSRSFNQAMTPADVGEIVNSRGRRLANSTSRPSPISLTTRPVCSAMSGSRSPSRNPVRR